jgi:hypothetical protein
VGFDVLFISQQPRLSREHIQNRNRGLGYFGSPRLASIVDEHTRCFHLAHLDQSTAQHGMAASGHFGSL